MGGQVHTWTVGFKSLLLQILQFSSPSSCLHMSHQFVLRLAITGGEEIHKDWSSNLLIIRKAQSVGFGLVIIIGYLVVRADKFSREGCHFPEKKKKNHNQQNCCQIMLIFSIY